ncbi:MAG TPA: hypothetical protein VMS17_21755 [Gemmataceae bacterium]|nr:hypothetical protein [Gemmataceae bacterium]
MAETDPPMLKAFVLCDGITNHAADGDQKDLQGAGLSRVPCMDSFPVKLSFWVFVQLSDQKETGEARLAIMRADSGRRYFFRPVAIRHADTMKAAIFCIRVLDCTFPERGVYFVELWYDDVWIVDQRLEIA